AVRVWNTPMTVYGFPLGVAMTVLPLSGRNRNADRPTGKGDRLHIRCRRQEFGGKRRYTEVQRRKRLLAACGVALVHSFFHSAGSPFSNSGRRCFITASLISLGKSAVVHRPAAAST